MSTIQYSNKEMEYLTKADKVLGDYIKKVGKIHRELKATPFVSLLSVIISQQISNKSAAKIEDGLAKVTGKEHISKVEVEDILKLDIDKIAVTGIGKKKAEWILEIAKKVKNKEIDFKKYLEMKDNEIIDDLANVEGIGIWSAKMFCIFGLGRMNIISYSDFGIRKGMTLLYKKDALTKQEFKEYSKRYEPYATVASIYLWHLANSVK